MPPRIVVTGAAGFIGRHVVRDLHAAGFIAIAIDRRPPPPSSEPLAQAITAELLDRDPRARRALAGADGVIHLAGRPGVRDTAPGVERLRHRDNVLATRAVLRGVRPDVPVIVASSSSVYGGSTGRPSRESDPLLPRGGYAVSKVGTEQVCARFIAAGRPITVVRPFTVLGAGQRADMAVSRWAAAVARGEPITIFGDPVRTRDLTDVREVSGALVDLLTAGHVGPLNLGSGQPRTLREIADAVALAVTGRVGPARLQVTAAHPDDPAATFADTTVLRSVLGRGLRINLHEAVADAVGMFGRAHLVS